MKIEKFDEKLTELKSKPVKKFSDLTEGEIYLVINKNDDNERSVKLLIEDIGPVIAPPCFLNNLGDHELPVYLLYNGKLKGKNKELSKLYSYAIMYCNYFSDDD